MSEHDWPAMTQEDMRTIEQLAALEDGLWSGEVDFVDDMARQMEDLGRITEKQRAWLHRIGDRVL